MTKDEKEAL